MEAGGAEAIHINDNDFEVVTLNSADHCFLCDKRAILEATEECINWELKRLFQLLKLSEAKMLRRVLRNYGAETGKDLAEKLHPQKLEFEAALCNVCVELVNNITENATETEIQLVLLQLADVLKKTCTNAENPNDHVMARNVSEGLRHELHKKCMLLLGSFRARQNVELIYASMLHLAVHKAMSTKAKKLNSVSFQDFKLGNQCNRGKSTEFGTSAVQIFSPKTEQYEGLHKSNLSYSPGGNKLNSVPCLHCNLAYQNFSEMQNHYLQTHMVDEFLTFKPLQQSSRGFREFCMNYFQQLVSKCNLEEPVCSNGAKCCYLECKSTFKDSLHLIKHLADKHKPEVVLDLRIALKKHARGESRGHFIGYAISTLRKPKETKKGRKVATLSVGSDTHEPVSRQTNCKKPVYPARKHKMFQCRHCEVVLSRVERLRDHEVRKHPEQIFLQKKPTDMSRTVFKSVVFKLFQKVRKRMMKENLEWECVYCKSRYKKDWYFIKHMCNEHYNNMTDQLVRMLEKCKGKCTFENVDGLNKQKTQCKYCKLKFCGQYKVDIHISHCHPEQVFLKEKPEWLEIKKFECLVRELLVKMGSNDKDGQWGKLKCEFCQNTYKQKSNLMGHLVTFHKDQVNKSLKKTLESDNMKVWLVGGKTAN